MLKRLVLALVLVVPAFVAGLVVTGRLRSAGDSAAATNSPPPPAPASSGAVTPPSPALLPDFTAVAGRAVNGVVNISSLQVVRTSNSPFATDPFFRYFFGDQEDLFGSRDRRELSLGSGVIVSPDGYVVTNNHVVGENVREITVALADKREMTGTIVGTDRMTDLALLKVEARGLPAVPWGDSSQLKPGEWVLAIGNPFQLSQTVTLGIVSAVGRANVGFADYEDFIQTDAAINTGNSGGALVNGRGELVGINTGILSQSGGYQGIGFAVPSKLARRVIQDLTRYGEVRRGSIGYLIVEPMTTQLADQLGLKDARGAFVSRMRRNSGAYQGGIRPGDVIVSFNGQPVDDASHFLRLVADAPAGRTVTVGVVREGRALTLKVPIGQTDRRSR